MRYEAKAPPRGKSLIWILLPVLALTIGLLGYDTRARMAANSADETLQHALARTTLSPDEVKNLLGRPADGAPFFVNGQLTQKFSWNGVLRSYFITVIYSLDDPPQVERILLNKEHEEGTPVGEAI